MIYMDQNTFETFSFGKEQKNQNLIEVDENIAYAVSVLNKKGYRTMFSCEGHYERGGDLAMDGQDIPCMLSMPYIAFESGIELPSVPEKWEKDVDDTLPVDENKVISGKWETLVAYCMATENEDVEMEYQFQKYKLEALLSLNAWVNELPPYEQK